MKTESRNEIIGWRVERREKVEDNVKRNDSMGGKKAAGERRRERD